MGLDVTVDEAGVVGEGQPGGHVACDPDQVILRKGLLPLQQGGQRIGVDVHCEVGEPVRLAHFQDPDDVGVV